MSEKALIEIFEIIEESQALETILDRESEEHVRWESRVKSFLGENLGLESEEYSKFTSLPWIETAQVVIGGPDNPRESHNPQLGINRVNREAYLRQLKVARGILLSINDRVERILIKNNEKINQFYSELKAGMALCSEGVLSVDELEEIKRKAEVLFEEVYSESKGEITFRKFHALRNSGEWIYRDRPKPGSGGVGREKLVVLSKLEELLKEKVAFLGEGVSVEDIHIFKGDQFTARKVVRGIIERAKQKLYLMDSYLDQTILEILETHLSENPSIEVKLLTTNKSRTKFNALVTDLGIFKNQYPSLSIELRDATNVTPSISHDRYIVLDDSMLFHSGHSFVDLGKATSRVSRVVNQGDVEKMLNEFNAVWSSSVVVI